MVRAVRDVLRVPGVRRVEVGWGFSLTSEQAGTVTLVAYSYASGGAGLVAAYIAASTLAGMCVMLCLAGVTGRVRREVLLRRVTAVRAMLLGLAALTAALRCSPLAVIALAVAGASLVKTYRPLQSSMLPWLVRTPADLASANVVAAVLENSGALCGPLLAGVLLAVGPAWIPMACAAAFVGLATLSLRHLVVPQLPAQVTRGPGQVAHDAASGLAGLARIAPPAGVAVLVFAQTFVRGALIVLIAVLAVKTLALGASAVGWLNTAIGAGGVAGAVVAAVVVRVTRLGRSFIAGLLLWGLPLAVLALTLTPASAYLALIVVGLGNALEDAGVFTLVLRLASPRIGGKVVAAKEFTALAGLGAGSVAAPWFLYGLGVRGTLVMLGGALAVLALVHARRFARLDRAMPAPGEEAELLRKLAMFAPLPLAVIELLATELTPHGVRAGHGGHARRRAWRSVPRDRRRFGAGQRARPAQTAAGPR
jgi:hypothetical protein